MLGKAKRVLQKQLIQPIVKGLSVLERWVFIPIYRVKEYLSRVYSLLASTIERLNTSKIILLEHLRDLLSYVAKLLMSLILVCGMLIFLLLLLMLVVVSYVLSPAIPSIAMRIVESCEKSNSGSSTCIPAILIPN